MTSSTPDGTTGFSTTTPTNPAQHDVQPAGGGGPSGLTSDEVATRTQRWGTNEIRREAPTSAFVVFLRQFGSPLVWLLAAACVVSAALGELVDAVAIGAIVILNSVVGFVQEHRAERAVLALRSMTAPRARVVRDGRQVVIPARDVVPGDCLLLEAGDVVAADAVLRQAHALSANEAMLTGESVPVEKRVGPVPPDAPLAERRDAVFMGTSIAAGTAHAEVTATGMRTELGKIAHLLGTVRDGATPLQQRLTRVGRTLILLCLGIVLVVAALGLWRGQAPLDVLLSAVSLAVAAVPEGLPAVVTIALAIGVQRMAARHVLIRRLPAVETLGCATVICTDKTGTLTTGVMTVREVWGPDRHAVLDAAAACADAELAADGRHGVGDPTEVALLVAAAAEGIYRPAIEAARPRLSVQPFDTTRKRMSVQRADGVLYVKGAVEAVLPLCATRLAGVEQANEEMARRGLRVLALAIGDTREEQQLRLLGLVGLADPPRPEAIAAVTAAREAGIRTVMITGDHPTTARAIAQEMGILGPGDVAEDVVHARATPEEKLRIVRAWKARSAIVAMTGDGVNDAPALREAHIGIAMGRTGTEVTREAADMILSDDNFASIVAAVETGRGVFDNIRKTLVYLLAGNAAELSVMLGASLAGFPLPLLPLHLLWINLVTDGLPALALVMDPTDPDVLTRPPRRTDEPILGRHEWRTVMTTGLLQTAVVLAVFAWTLQTHGLTAARTMAFSALVFGELFRAFAARSEHKTFWEVGAFSNLRLLAVIAVSALMQAAILLLPAGRWLFGLAPLDLTEALVCVLVALLPVTVIEVAKLAVRKNRPRRGKVRGRPSSPPAHDA